MSKATQNQAMEDPLTRWMQRPERGITTPPVELRRILPERRQLLKQPPGFVFKVALETDHFFQLPSRGCQVAFTEKGLGHIVVRFFQIRRVAQGDSLLERGNALIRLTGQQIAYAKEEKRACIFRIQFRGLAQAADGARVVALLIMLHRHAELARGFVLRTAENRGCVSGRVETREFGKGRTGRPWLHSLGRRYGR